MKSGNPVLREGTFSQAAEGYKGAVMTLDGTAVKAGVLGGLVVLSAAWPWHQYFGQGLDSSALLPYLLLGSIGGLIVAVITIFCKTASPITAPIYAVLEGLALGSVSVLYEKQYPGIALQAVGLTFAVLGAFLFAYTTRLIRPSQGFMRGVALATGGITLYYIVAFIMTCFGLHAPLIWSSGPLGIGFSLVVCAVAAFNLLIDFDFIDRGVQQGAPKYMEWYGAFSLMVTMVWLYLEILRLVSKLNKR